MKVLFYIPTLAAGGAEKQCAMTAAGLKKVFAHDTCVVLDYAEKVNDSNKAILKDAGVPIVGLEGGTIAKFRQLRKLLAANRDAVMFSYLTRPNFVGGLVARSVGFRNIFTGIRTTVLPLPKFVAEACAARFFAKGVIYNAHTANESFSRRWFPKAKGMTISNAITVWNDVPSRDKSDILRVVAVGRFVPEKDYVTWCRAIRRVKDAGVEVRATIIGWGAEEAGVRGLMANLGLDGDVTILPGNSDVRKTLYASNVYLSTSRFEGVSNSILEAMNAALPVVATDVGDNRYMLSDGKSGYLVEIGDVEAIATHLVELARSPDKRQGFGEMNHERVKALYSPEKLLASYNEIIKSVQ